MATKAPLNGDYSRQMVTKVYTDANEDKMPLLPYLSYGQMSIKLKMFSRNVCYIDLWQLLTEGRHDIINKFFIFFVFQIFPRKWNRWRQSPARWHKWTATPSSLGHGKCCNVATNKTNLLLQHYFFCFYCCWLAGCCCCNCILIW